MRGEEDPFSSHSYEEENRSGSEEGGEDLFGEELEDDYAEDSSLDRYKTEEDDEKYIPPLTMREFSGAEKEIAKMLGEERESEEDWRGKKPEKEKEQKIEIKDFDIVKNMVDNVEVKEAMKREVVKFLKTFGNRKYVEAIKQMASLNMQSIYVDYFDLEKSNEAVALSVVSFPSKILPVLNEALSSVVKEIFPRYFLIRPVLVCRIIGIPSFDQIRTLRKSHLNTLVKVVGIVTKRSRVYPMLSVVKYNCQKCKGLLGPFVVDSEEVRPNRCVECQSSGPFAVNTAETIYKDFQKLTVQEVPGKVPPGRLPRSKEVVTMHDLIDHARPGDEIELTGVYKNNFSNASSNIANAAPVFTTTIEALSIVKRGDEASMFSITPEEEKEILKLSKLENIFELILSSIAPSIHGQREAKRAIALAIFGGVPKHLEAKHNVRGDINVLLLGDPGMAKSQLLKYVEKISHRAAFATGQGASAVGLTAMVRKDPSTGEWALEGGALVLADKGVCLIDEFDKMKDTDRVSIHEAMEQQSISISKAGIVTSLQARCAVIAAANPIRGKYNASYTFSQNVNLTDPIISRFDVICVIKDENNEKYDRELAQFIVKSHVSSQTSAQIDGVLSQTVLRKYISYARERISPKIENFDVERIKSLYSSLRKESSLAGGLPITVRHVESIVRISEASAKMHLREYVLKKDIDLAIRVVLDSFCGSQKLAVKKALSKKFSRYLPKTEEDLENSLSLLSSMFRSAEKSGSIATASFKKKLEPLGLYSRNIYTSNEFLSQYKISECGEYILRK